MKVPDGFAITAQAYRDFLRQAGLERNIHNLLGELDTKNLDALRNCGSTVREAILSAPFPSDLESDVLAAYDQLQQTSDATAGVAVRSSATAEDLPEASFAGEQETYLNCTGTSRVDRCLSALFRFTLYGSRDFISRRSRIRSSQDRALHRRATHGALRSRRSRRHVHHRHGNRFSRRGVNQRGLRPWRERRPRVGESG